MPQPENIEQLWTNENGETEKRGSLYDGRQKLIASFDRVKSLGKSMPEVTINKNGTLSPVTSFNIKLVDGENDTKKRLIRFEAKALLTNADGMHIAIQKAPSKDTDTIDSFPTQYFINPDGTVVSKDELLSNELSAGVSEEEELIVSRAAFSISQNLNQLAEKAQSHINNEIERKKNNRRRTMLRFGGVALTLGVVGGIGVGAYTAWNELINKPGIAEDARRQAYDEQLHTIDGPGIEIDNQQFGIMPVTDFDQIPQFRSGESIESPRVIQLGSSNGCAEILTSSELDSASVTIATRQYNPLGAYPVIAYASDQNTLNICAVGKLDSELSGEDLEIAVQLKAD